MIRADTKSCRDIITSFKTLSFIAEQSPRARSLENDNGNIITPGAKAAFIVLCTGVRF